jgi:localization factor PodJL
MTAGAPWSVKGIDPKAREVAKGLARRAGMTLGEWLNRVILEDDVPEEVTSEAQFGMRQPRYDAAKPYIGGPPLSVRPDDMSRVAFALDRLTDRIEASETRTGLAISGVEHSVRHAVARIETAEREHMAVAARFDAAAERLEAEQALAAERLRRMEAATSGPRSAEALRALEQAVTRVAEHLHGGEERTRTLFNGLEARIARAEAFTGGDPAALIDEVVERLGARVGAAESNTTEALETLRGSLADLDHRMRSVEGGARPEFDQRLEGLAEQLARQVEEARSEIAGRLVASGPGQVEARLEEITRQISAVEQRSAQAIEAMGRDVLTMAETLHSRVQGAEQRSAEAIEQVGGEIARIAGAVEDRLGRVDQLHAEALERLGSDIGRITDGLTERIIQSERRAAQAIDDVGEQVAKVTERIEQRHERASTDLAERIRQSEARTVRLLEEARARMEGRRPRLVETAEPVEMVPSEPEFTPATVAAVFGPELFSRAEPVSQPALDPENPAFAQEDFEAAGSFMPILETEDEPAPASFEAEETAAPQLSTREVIEQARAAARAAAAAAPAEVTPRAEPPLAVAGERRRARGLFGMLKPGRPTSTWQTALLVAGGAAFLSLGAAGVVLTEGAGGRHGAQASPAPEFPPRAAVALAPQPLIAPDFPPAHAAAPVAGSSDYADVAEAVEQRQPGALARLKALADAGDVPSQAHLAKLYEGGLAGVTQNLPEARRWMSRAADAGDPSAMHGLALYAFRGEGGPQNTAAAVQWFRKAAERGMVDSQYNLALLYEAGSGVGRDPVQAYKWFSVAARSGDTEARAKAKALADTLSAPQLAAAESAAANFQPIVEIPRPAASSGVTLAEAQKILGRLGYYQGPVGAAARPRDLQLAVSAYQRDQGLASTGALDPATLSRLAAFTR